MTNGKCIHATKWENGREGRIKGGHTAFVYCPYRFDTTITG